MRVVLDTNVLVSAFTTRGLCADVLRTVFAQHDLVCPQAVLDELARVLSTRFGLPATTVSAILRLLDEFECVPHQTTLPDIPLRDPDDLHVLAAALHAKVDVLVTGDKDLLELGEQSPVTILHPRGFWERVREAGKH